MKKIKFLIIISLVIIFPFQIVMGMQSANYKIEKDSINFGGTDGGQSANYNLDDTMGEVGTGLADSENYIMKAGYRQATEEVVDPTFTFAISSTTCALGTLTTASVSSCTYNITTSTNAEDGYTTTIIEDGNLRDGTPDIDDISDGTVTAGSEEYGVSSNDADSLDIVTTSGDVASSITGTAKSIATQASGPVSADAVTVTHHASIAATTIAGSYSHVVTLVSTGTF